MLLTIILQRHLLFSGMDLPFEWDEAEAFVRLPDRSLFSWCERFRCYNHIIYGIVSYLCPFNYIITINFTTLFKSKFFFFFNHSNQC